MLTAFAILLVVHGLIHVLGTAKAFSWADLPQLTQPISVTFGALWLLAALLFLTTAVSLFVWPRVWWAIGVCAVVVSMLVIVPDVDGCEVRRAGKHRRPGGCCVRIPEPGTLQPPSGVRAGRRGSRACEASDAARH